jgi:hypothetical protein
MVIELRYELPAVLWNIKKGKSNRQSQINIDKWFYVAVFYMCFPYISTHF